MATIPMGNFGQAVARPAGQPQLARGNPLAQAAGDVAQTGEAIVNDMAARQTDLVERQRRADSALALAKASNAMHEAHDDVARRVADGSLEPDKALGELDKLTSKAVGPMLDGYTPEQRTTMQAHLAQVGGTLGRSIDGEVFKRKQQDTAATIDQFGEQVSREAMRAGPAWAAQKYGAMVDFAGDAAGLSEPKRSKLKQAFSERVHATFYEQAGVGALTKGDADGLGKLIGQIDGPEGEALDPAKRAVLKHQLFGWQQSILAQRDRAANRAEDEGRRRHNDAVDVYNKATDVAMGGGYFSPEFITELTTKAHGTDMEPAVVALIGSQRLVAGFASKPADQRAAEIERMRAERATPGQGTDAIGDKLLQALVGMDSKLRAQADDNPWAAAQQAGRIREAPVFNVADPTSVIQTVRQRMSLITDVEGWTGKRISPLQPVEVEQLGKLVRQLPVDQAATMLAGIGAALGNSDRVAALSKQMHDKDGSLGLAMMYASAQTSQGRGVAELLLRGDQALRDKTVMVDKAAETGWQGTIAKSIRGAYASPETEDQAIKAAFLIAAAKFAENGSPNIPEAVRLATGGIVERNGQKIPLPWGMDEKAFDKRIESFKAEDFMPQMRGRSNVVWVGKAAIPLDEFVAQLPKATLVHAGQGLYAVRAGTGFVTNVDGQRIVLRVAP